MQDSVCRVVQPSHERVGNTGRFGALERATNWQAVLGKLADPAFAGLTNKPPFRALAQWAKPLAVQAENHRELAQLNVTFETMLVGFISRVRRIRMFKFQKRGRKKRLMAESTKPSGTSISRCWISWKTAIK